MKFDVEPKRKAPPVIPEELRKTPLITNDKIIILCVAGLIIGGIIIAYGFGLFDFDFASSEPEKICPDLTCPTIPACPKCPDCPNCPDIDCPNCNCPSVTFNENTQTITSLNSSCMEFDQVLHVKLYNSTHIQTSRMDFTGNLYRLDNITITNIDEIEIIIGG